MSADLVAAVSPAAIGLLRIFARHNPSTLTQMAVLAGGPVRQQADRLAALRLIRARRGVPQSDSRVGAVYQITPAGRAVVVAADHAAQTAPPKPAHKARKSDYDGADLRPYTGRPGANEWNSHPSRIGNELRYRDGRAERAPA